MSSIKIFTQEISFSVKHKKAIYQWLNQIADSYQAKISSITYILCSDEYLLKLNLDYLNHDTLTDIITFPYNEELDSIESDIFISVDRIKENAKAFGVSVENELHRVMAHGLLHLLGQDDVSPKLKLEMREKEDYYLSLRPEILIG